MNNTFAAFKRRITVGTIIHSENHKRPHVTGPRPVTKVQGNGIWYTMPDNAGKEARGFTEWPPVSRVRMNEDGSATFSDKKDGEPFFTYTIIEPEHYHVRAPDDTVYSGPTEDCPICKEDSQGLDTTKGND